MPNRLYTLLLGFLLFLGSGAPLFAQPAEKTDKGEPTRIERDGGSTAVPYTLAAIAAIIVMALVCVPVRRD